MNNKIKNNKNNKTIEKILNGITLPLITIIIIYTVMIIILNSSVNNIKKHYQKSLNAKMNNVLVTLKSQYPDIDEEKLVVLLKENNDLKLKESQENILKKYGYENIIYDKEVEDLLKNVKDITIYLSIIAAIAVILVIIIDTYKKNKNIDEIIKYLDELNQGIYNLNIDENAEGYLSRLQNEIYKITIYLRESMEESNNKNKQLQIALEDISHQIKTPITALRSSLDCIIENPDMDKKTMMEFLRSISVQTDYISELVISLLNMAKLDSNSFEMKREKIDLMEIINKSLEKLDIFIDIKNMKININKDDKEHIVVVDKKWEVEAVTNILKNAIEHSNDDGKIDINLEDNLVYTKLEIIDYGKGISKDDINHIFERFYKSKNSSRNSVGIGLALAKTVFEKDNAYIICESEEGKYTKFTIKYLKINKVKDK